jgi:trehalose-phosphatase
MVPNIYISKSDYDAVIFDLDGVITRTARVHADAWKKLFDEYLARHSQGKWDPFDVEKDYRRYVDGKPRYDGVESFLTSRGIANPYGNPKDGPDKETVCGLGNRKNQFFNQMLREKGVEVFERTIQLIHALRSAGMKTAVVSLSKNCEAVLKTAGIADLFDAKADGQDLEALHMEGKPSPDIYLEAARRLGVDPDRAAVVEDAISGVEAGKRGHFGLVIGVDRGGQESELERAGADMVVTTLSSVTTGPPHALKSMEEIRSLTEGKTPAVFLDYDGTLTPIVADPEKAHLSDSMLRVLNELSENLRVAVISGRDLPDVQRMVGISTLFYAGSHGFDIAGPKDSHLNQQKGSEFLPALDRAEKQLREKLETVKGSRVERKKFAIAVHYRNVEADKIESIKKVVKDVASRHPDLRRSGGKKIFELQPKIDWNKGKALLWLLEMMDIHKPDVIPFYIGDDVTDEDAFKTLKGLGISIVVMDKPRPTEAQYRLNDPNEVEAFLESLVKEQGPPKERDQ